MEPAEYARVVGERLRAVRLSQGLSLAQAEAKSGGAHRSSVIGTYERGDRSLTLAKAAGLAELYGVPLAPLLADDSAEDEALAVVEEFPSELSLSRDGWGRHVLLIDGPGLQGTAVSTSRELVLAIAEAYAAMRREQRSAA